MNVDSPRPPGSSPFAFPLPSFSPFPIPPTSVPSTTANPNLLGPSPNPFSIPSNPAGSTPFPLGSFANSSSPWTFPFAPGSTGMNGTATGFTPNFAQNGQAAQNAHNLPFGLAAVPANSGSTNTSGPAGTGVMGTMGPMGGLAGMSGMASMAGMTGVGGMGVGAQTELDAVGQMKAGLEALSAGVDRAMVVLQEIRRMEDGLFVGSQAGRSEGMECGIGGLSKLELLHIEYTQLLSSLLSLSTTSLVSALPCPAADVSGPKSQPGPPTIDDLTSDAERRANLEFNRRESVRVASKTVLDVLNKR